MERKRHATLLLAVIALLGGCATAGIPIKPEDGMPYPPKAPGAEDIFHVPTGLKMTFSQAMDTVSGARLIFVGETHNNVNAHRVELEVIKELHRRFPGQLAVGMEMFREDQQEALDKWTKGKLTELEFLKESKWYDNWGSDFGYYRDILNFARDNRLDLVALNPPRELQQKVSMSPPDKLPPDIQAKLPEIDDTDPYAKAVLKAIFAGHTKSEKMFDSFFRVQQLWEETMAQKVVDYLSGPAGREKKMVTVTGAGHIMYGYNVPKKVLRRMPLPYAIIIPEEISIPEDRKEELTMDVDLPELPLLKSDFVWWVEYEDLEGKRMRLGVRLARSGKLVVEEVEEGSPAANAGVLKGDEILSLDGRSIADMTDLYFLLDGKKEGDRGTLAVKREEKEIPLPITFFPLPKKKK